ncbi:hypothetical protein DXT99_23180 [Pontibacter diazotrophicus]|uniref:Uncharacterized protein n=2 Tax=Pontibacter diazotrophicus TaxID=1400979 RepID=A0A3D8L377_9BACT|nr:hypothetical protein DXT99_23180 [Pontibacter diazotrophicus]
MELFYNYLYEDTDAGTLVSELKKIEALAQQSLRGSTGECVLFRFFEGGKLTTVGDMEKVLAAPCHPNYAQLQEALKRAVLRNELQV